MSAVMLFQQWCYLLKNLIILLRFLWKTFSVNEFKSCSNLQLMRPQFFFVKIQLREYILRSFREIKSKFCTINVIGKKNINCLIEERSYLRSLNLNFILRELFPCSFKKLFFITKYPPKITSALIQQFDCAQKLVHFQTER